MVLPPEHLRLGTEIPSGESPRGSAMGRPSAERNRPRSLVKNRRRIVGGQPEQLQFVKGALARPGGGQVVVRLRDLRGRQTLLRDFAHHVPDRQYSVLLAR